MGVAIRCLSLILFFISFVSVSAALADPTTSVDLGTRKQGQSFPFLLTAENVNCDQPVDFRFTSNAPWLRIPADPIVRGVAKGQTKNLLATIDLSGLAPGRYEAHIDVECENCGWFVAKQCKLDRQQIQVLVDVAPAAAGQQPVGPRACGQNALQGSLDPNDPRIPEAQRRKLKDAIKDWENAVAAKGPCDEELKKLKDTADKAKAEAEAARKKAKEAQDTSDKAQKNAEDARQKVNDAVDKANKAHQAVADAEKAKAESDAGNPTTDERKAAKKAVEDAKAAEEAAIKAVKDAQAAEQAAIAAAKEAAKAAAQAQKPVAEAEKKAGAASAAADAKAKECEKLAAAAAAAAAAKDKAEKDARDAIKPPAAAKKPTPEQIEAQRKKLRDCAQELGELLEAQRLALAALGKLGALKEGYESDLEAWGKAVDGATGILKWAPPGTPFAGAVNLGLTAVRFVIGIARGVSGVGNTVHVPKSGNDVVDPKATKQWLKDNGFAKDDAEAGRVYDQMKNYSKPPAASTPSSMPESAQKMENMIKQIETKKAECEATANELDKLEKAAK